MCPIYSNIELLRIKAGSESVRLTREVEGEIPSQHRQFLAYSSEVEQLTVNQYVPGSIPGMPDGLYRVVTSYLCAGFVIENGKVTRYAPILRNKLNYWITIAIKV